MASWLQHGPERLMTMAMRGGAKTFIGIAFANWWLLREPNHNVLVLSASRQKAESFSNLSREWIRSIEVLKPLTPRRGQRDNVAKFDVGLKSTASADASLTAYGITGQITGGRANLILADDIEVPDNSMTQDQRQKLWDKFTEVESIIQPAHMGAKIVVNGTPQTEESIYMRLPDAGYAIRSWPARCPHPDRESQMRFLSQTIRDRLDEGKIAPGDPTFPERYDHEELLKRETSMGKSKFALQFMLDTELSDEERYPLKLKDLMVYNPPIDKAPVTFSWASGKRQRLDFPSVGFGHDCFYEPMEESDLCAEYQDRVLAIDPAGRGPDETGYACGAFLNGNVFVWETGGFNNVHDSGNMEKLAELCWKHRINRVTIEDIAGYGQFGNLLQPYLKSWYEVRKTKGDDPYDRHHPVVEPIKRATGQKEHRIIDCLEPLFNQHRIIISEHVAQDRTLCYQMTRLTRDRECLEHDDRIDALYLLAASFHEFTMLDPKEMERDLHRQMVEEELKNWVSSHRGQSYDGIVSLSSSPRIYNTRWNT